MSEMLVEDAESPAASPHTIDFTNVPMSLTGDDSVLIQDTPLNSKGRVMSKKQIRARVRRAMAKGQNPDPEDAKALVIKPVEDWDLEELARGRPRASDGTFSGRPPQWVTREIHERAMDMFKDLVKRNMRSQTITAMEVVGEILTSTEVDVRGKPVVSASTKLDAAKFLVEHSIGKAVQPIEQEISVKLQAMLGVAIVNPGEDGTLILAHQGTRGELTAADDDDDIEDAEIVDG